MTDRSDPAVPIVTPRFLALAALVLVPLYVWAGLGNRDVWAPDEPRYALVTREMQARGNYIFPTVNGEPYAHKPPLLFWSIAASSALTGKDPADGFTARLPSMLAGLGTLALTAVIGAELFAPAVGATSALVLATMHLFCWESHSAQMDAMLTFWITLAMLFLVRHRRGAAARDAYLFHLACGLATLTKGPVGFLIPWAVALLWPVDEGLTWRRRDLFRPRFLLPFLVPVLCWLGGVAAHGGRAFIQEMLMRHVVRRYMSSWHHERPWHYFLTATPLNMLPWSVFLPAAALFAYERRRDPGSGGLRFAVAWVLFMLVFFSIPKGKRGLYMLPSFPALALLIGATLEASRDAAGRLRRAVYAGFILVPVLSVVVLKAMARGQIEGVPADFAPMRACSVTALAIVAYGFYRWTVPHLVRVSVLSTALLFFGIYSTVLDQLDAQKSPRAFCALAKTLRRPGERFAYFGIFLEQYPLFTGERLLAWKDQPRDRDPAEFVRLIANEPSVLTFMQKEFLPQLRARTEVALEVLSEKHIGGKDMVMARVTPRNRTASRSE